MLESFAVLYALCMFTLGFWGLCLSDNRFARHTTARFALDTPAPVTLAKPRPFPAVRPRAARVREIHTQAAIRRRAYCAPLPVATVQALAPVKAPQRPPEANKRPALPWAPGETRKAMMQAVQAHNAHRRRYGAATVALVEAVKPPRNVRGPLGRFLPVSPLAGGKVWCDK